jgi:Na+-driven multidrug efflux pump
MLAFLKNHPYIFSLALALLTASLTWLYARTIEKDKDKVNKTFNKTLAAGVVAALALTWLVHREEPVSREPFISEQF